MSRDIFVQDIPPDAQSVEDIPDDFAPRPLGLNRAAIIAIIKEMAPETDSSDPAWVRIDWPGPKTADSTLDGEWLHAPSVEVNLGSDEQVKDFAFHVRGDVEALCLVARILRRLNLRAIDTDSDSGLFVDPDICQE